MGFVVSIGRWRCVNELIREYERRRHHYVSRGAHNHGVKRYADIVLCSLGVSCFYGLPYGSNAKPW